MDTSSSGEVARTCVMIVARVGGLDGVALQAREYRYLLNGLGINIQMVTGLSETAFGPIDPIGQRMTTVRRLSFDHDISRVIYANQFTEGPQTRLAEAISDDRWHELFEDHKGKIRKAIASVIESVPNHTPIFVYNLLALRHSHPAGAVAVRELIDAFPDRGFISHAADPDAERPEIVARLKDHALRVLSAAPPGEPYSGGPYHAENLYHIVLNPTQADTFVNKYGVPKNHIFEIPDFLDFPSRDPVFRRSANPVFLDYVSDCRLTSRNDSYGYRREIVERDAVFFLSPVRPVSRKRLKEAMLLAEQYGKARNRQIVFIVTHPNKDDAVYFMDSLRFAESIGLRYYHVGKTFSLETLEDVYENLAALDTIGVVASSAGGWENALNEMARYGIPFYMNKKLNSFKPLTERIGMRTHGTDFGMFSDIVQNRDPSLLRSVDLTGHPEAAAAFAWIDRMLTAGDREETIAHNYRAAYDYLSHEATVPRIRSAFEYVSSRV